VPYRDTPVGALAPEASLFETANLSG